MKLIAKQPIDKRPKLILYNVNKEASEKLKEALQKRNSIPIYNVKILFKMVPKNGTISIIDIHRETLNI